jgi:hypothetical protein
MEVIHGSLRIPANSYLFQNKRFEFIFKLLKFWPQNPESGSRSRTEKELLDLTSASYAVRSCTRGVKRERRRKRDHPGMNVTGEVLTGTRGNYATDKKVNKPLLKTMAPYRFKKY